MVRNYANSLVISKTLCQRFEPSEHTLRAFSTTELQHFHHALNLLLTLPRKRTPLTPLEKTRYTRITQRIDTVLARRKR